MNEVVLIPATSYIYRVSHRTMEGDCQVDHGPRMVHLPSFRIGRYPVTNHLFQRFLSESGYCPKDEENFLKHWQNGIYPEEAAHHPVVWVSHADACAYAVWAGGRLPTDEEWQLAAGGMDKHPWPWGSAYREELCNASGNETTAVDAFPGGASPFGCMDMCGNTWEWTREVVDDGHHLFTLLRGGSSYKAQDHWHADGGPKRNDFHWKFPLLNEALNRCGTVGFRCVWEGEGT